MLTVLRQAQDCGAYRNRWPTRAMAISSSAAMTCPAVPLAMIALSLAKSRAEAVANRAEDQDRKSVV